MTKNLKDAFMLGPRFHLHRLLFFAVALVFALALAPSARPVINSTKDEKKSVKAESRFTKLDGARIHYVNYGKGSEALVLIHGWTCNLDNWRDQMPDFAKRNRVIAIDLPGHGQSDKPQITYSMDLFARAVEAVLRDASENGQLPIVFDTSPCTYRMKRYLAGRLAVQDSIEFVHDFVLPRVGIEAIAGPVAIHPVCSLRKMGTADKLAAVAARCSRDVVQVDEVLCCGFAGEKGFSRPELNEHALRHLKSGLPVECVQGYSSSRTCEIGLSEYSGFPYRSIICLVDACTSASRTHTPAVNEREQHVHAGHAD